MLRPLLILCLIISYPAFCQSQNETEVKIERKAKKWDTLKYHKFETVLIVGFFQQYRTFSTELTQSMHKDSLGLSNCTFTTEIDFAGAAGLVLNYDKFQLAIGKSIKPPDNAGGRGHTEVFGVGLSVGDNRWVSENYYRKFTGFYDPNSAKKDSVTNPEGKYTLEPGLTSSLIMTRFMYFRNYKNYCYKAGFGCNYRQLKSAMTMIYGASFSIFDLKGDSAILPVKARQFYNEYGQLTGMHSVNLSANIGLAGTLVLFKAWFIGGYFTIGPEQQWRNIDLSSEHRKISYVSWSGVGRLSMGLNLKRCYLIWSFANDYNVYNGKKTFNLKSEAKTLSTTFGWRFHYRTPKFYQNFQQTKLYGYL